MAWEWFDNLKGFSGGFGYSNSSGLTWDEILASISSGTEFSYGPTVNGDTLVLEADSDYCFDGTVLDEKTVDSGEGYKFHYSSTQFMAVGDCSFITDIPNSTFNPGATGYFSPGIGGLMVKNTIRFAINHDLHRATVLTLRSFPNGGWYTQCNSMLAYSSTDILEVLYDYLLAHVPSSYTWSTVSSVTGKNGKYTLTKILNINDGEPVDNITNKGNLDFSKKTKVNTLVADSFVPEHREDATKALAKYEVQNKVYSYCTLVYKKGEIPNDVTDGTVIQIDPDGDEVAITGLEENKTYYFVIFTNKTTSEPYRFRTGHNEVSVGIIFEIAQIMKPGVEDEIIEEIEINKIS